MGLKLVIRFIVDPMIWEAMKSAQRHIALLSPSPGAGLDVASFMGPIINQSVYSRLLLFMMTNDGAVDLLTVQFVISLNELMMNLTLKHRDAFFTRYGRRAFPKSKHPRLMPRMECSYASLTNTISAPEYMKVHPLCINRPSRDLGSETHDGWVVRTRYASSAPMANSAAKYWMIVMTTIRVRCEVARA